MDALAPVAEVTRRLPRPISAGIGWHIGERAARRARVANTAGGTTTVKVTTVDTYCEEHGLLPDVIKIDVEGFEYQVMVGAERTLPGARPLAVICEITPNRDDPAAIVAMMNRHGYQPHSISDDGEITPMDSAEDTGPAGPAHTPRDPSCFYNVCFTPSRSA